MPAPSATTVQMRVGSFPIEEARQNTDNLNCKDDDKFSDEKSLQMLTSVSRETYNILSVDSTQSNNMINRSLPNQLDPLERSLNPTDGRNDSSGGMLVPGHLPIPAHQLVSQNRVIINQSQVTINQNQNTTEVSIARPQEMAPVDHVEDGMQNIRNNVNYQLLEHNISHQSILNQSISILNQQVIANRISAQVPVAHSVTEYNGNLSMEPPEVHLEGHEAVGGGTRAAEGEIVVVNNVPHQFVRTPDGLVLAMLPQAPVASLQSDGSNGSELFSVNVQNAGDGVQKVVSGQCTDSNVEMSVPRTVQPQICSSQTIMVPYGWRRIVNGSSVLYISPSGAALSALQHLREYLQTPGTCKCGLTCPLRAEHAFSFDPKVSSKAYEWEPDASRADLTKLCNHKRKMLALSQQPESARKGDLAIPDTAAMKRKKKKRSPVQNISVSQLMARRDRTQDARGWQNTPPNQCMQETMDSNGVGSPSVQPVRANNQLCLPSTNNSALLPSQQMNQQQTCQLMNKSDSNELTNQILTQNTDIQLNRNMPTRNHYLTVNGGCINPSAVLQTVDNSQKMPFQSLVQKTDVPCTIESQGSPVPVGNMQVNTINHILGPNGQIIGVHTGLPRSDAMMLSTPMPANKSHPVSNQTSENGTKLQNTVMFNKIEDKTYNYTESQNPNPCSMNVNSVNVTQNQDSSSGPMNMFCGSNPPALTPEVMQKINQQQQLFIQQNQKQIEMAMKGIRSQIIAGSTQLKPTIPNQTSHVNNIQQSPGQLIIQNGTVMVGNQTKPIPWTAKRNKTQSVQNSTSQNINNPPIRMGFKSGEFNDNHIHHNNISIPQGQIQPNQDSGSPQSQNTNVVNSNVYSRVPPLHQHCPQTPQQTWPIVESHKKKGKSGKYNKKNRLNHDNQNMHGVDGSNFDNRHNQDNYRSNNMLCQNDFNINANPSPSFMEDPSGYLAQQTALLNNTISRQVGNNGNLMMYNNSHSQNMSSNQHINSNERNIQMVKANQNDYCLSRNNACESSSSGQINRSNGNNSIHNSPSQSNIPDSSMIIEKRLEGTKNNAMTNHCKGCMATKQSPTVNLEQCMSDTIVRLPNGGFFMKAHQYQDSSCKSETDSQSESPSPNQSIDDNPVTSSTFLDRPGSQTNHLLQDSRGPIQGGTVSTSNVSPMETMQLPEPSPTPSNSSRNTDTPQSNNSGSIHISSSCPFAVPSPAYSNPGSCRESTNSNPATPTPSNVQNIPQYNSPGSTFSQNAPVTQSQGISNQMINFISNHNVNRNIMDSESVNTLQGGNLIMKNFQNMSNSNYPLTNNSFVQMDQKRQVPNQNMLMPGYCPPPHLGGGPATSCLMMPSNQMHKVVTTMASGHTMIRDTITSVLAGKALTATTSINASSNTSYNRSHVLPNMLNSYAIPPNHPDPFINSVNLPTSYPMHIAGTIAQSMISKSPLEMVQSIVSSIPISRQENTISPCTTAPSQHGQVKSTPVSQNMQQGQILIASNGQIMVAENNHGTVMPPPAPKNHIVTPLPPMPASPLVTNVTASVTQVIPAVGGIQQVLNQPTVLVNTLPTPFVIQPQMMTVDGQVMQQNTVLPQIVSGNVISHGQQSVNDGGVNDVSKAGIMPRTLLSPETSKKKGKKRKNQNMAGMLHIAAQQSSGGMLVHHTSPQQSPQFSPRSFQVSPNQSISTAPMLQALTIVPGKSGTPAHIVMNSQTAAGNFGSQQIITNSPPTQQINLLQPVNLINNTAGVVPNFPAFQQFIVPGLGGMVMTADGTLLQDTGGMSMQLQLQNVNGQNVLTPVQNQGVLTTGGNTGVVIRTQNPHGKIMQSQQSPGAQFLSPNSQIMMNSPGFNGQLSPLIANVSPSSVAFNTSPQQVRSANIQPQEFIQCSNQMGQTLMVPMSPNQITMSSASTNQANATFVQQNTTIVQQQTTMVANNQSNGVAPGNNGNIVLPGNGTRLSIDPNIIFNQTNKQQGAQMKGKTMMHFQNAPTQQQPTNQSQLMPTSEMSNTKKLAVHHIPSQINQEQTTKIEMQHKKDNLNANHMSAHMNMNQQSITSQQIVQTMQQNTPLFNPNVRHSVSTQTLVNQQQQAGMKSPPVSHYTQQISGSSPPDTTTHSPLGPLENLSSSPTIHNARSVSNQGNYADTTTKSPEPNDQSSLAMVQCVSSSEPDMTDLKEQGSWAPSHNEFNGDINIQNAMMMQHAQQLPNQAPIYSVESNSMQFNAQTITVTSVNNQHSITITPANYYDRFNSNKRKNEFGDMPQNNFRNEKMMRTTTTSVGQGVPMTEIMNYNEPNALSRVSFDKSQETIQRQYASQELPHNHRMINKNDHGTNIRMQKVYERHMNSGNEVVN